MSPGAHSQEISRQNKGCFLFLLDQSFSMNKPLGRSSKRKCEEFGHGDQWLAAEHGHPGHRRSGH